MAAKVTASEMRWSIAALILWVAILGIAIAALVTRSDTLAYLDGGLALLYALCAWRVEGFENDRRPDKARPVPLAASMVFLVIIYPFIAAVFIVPVVIAALIKGENVLHAAGYGALLGLMAIPLIAILKMVKQLGWKLIRGRSSPR